MNKPQNHEPELIAQGDEWAKYRYRGVVLFDTSCGNAGVYDGHHYLGRTLEEAMQKIDRQKDVK